MTLVQSKPAVFFDRDDTLIKDCHYLKDPDLVTPIPGAIEGCKVLHDAGYCLIIVTNQSGIGRGLLTESDFLACQRRLIELFGSNTLFSGHYFCPHHPTEAEPKYKIDCNCRKPKTGLLTQAAKHHHIDLSRSFMVGDKLSDVEAGLNAGCRSILFNSSSRSNAAHAHAKSFDDIVSYILTADD